MDPIRERIQAARKDEDSAFAELLGKPANLEALQAFAESVIRISLVLVNSFQKYGFVAASKRRQFPVIL
ncbi:MAG: hypothetical protein CM15mP49_23400 [Actinomycetota bacterium]|nr:MAG: hypothetical protein CM15mP49_23400 [Actinomycetota bacterium]